MRVEYRKQGGAQARVERDWLEDGNAHELAQRIAAYWQQRAKPGEPPVLVHVERQALRSERMTFSVVRSNLIAGMPPRVAA